VDSRLVLPVNTVLDGSYRIARVVGSGGFGITYEAEDINLGTMVAIKEYYPFDFGDRDRTMSVRPKSDRHKQTFEWGRSNFLQEARTLARFEHPSIVRVTRVFEANSTAYMVMRFEQGQSFEEWLRGLGRPPTQEELDIVIAPLLDALQMMHAANFLHRDIAPDNIIIRTDGTPVLLDFGAARRAVAEMSRSLTGIVKAGYSPHEQYTSDGRLQGPWSDLYAFGGTLYRAVTGKAPEEATLRFDEDRMAPAAQAARGKYRRDFLGAIDTCLKVRHSERPRTVAQLRPMLLGAKSQPKGTQRLIEPTYKLPREDAPSARASALRQAGRRWPAIAAAVAVVAGAYGGFEYRRWSASEGSDGVGTLSTKDAESQRKAAAEAAAQRQAALEAERLKKEKEEAEARQRHAALEAERRQKEQEAADARQRQIEIEEARRRKELADAAEAEARRKAVAEAEAKRKEELRIAALEEERRRIAAAEEARRKEQAAAEAEARRKAEAAAEAKRKEDLRIAALEEERRRIAAAEEARRKEQAAAEAEARRKAEAAAEAKRKEELRIAALEDEKRRKEQQAEAEARRKAEATAEAKRKEELRIAALEDERRRKEQVEVEARRKAEAAAEAKRKELAEAEEKRRIAALEDARRKEQAAAEEKVREERRIAALEETRRADEKRKEDERLRLAAIPDDEKRAELVRKVQMVLKRSRCWDGELNGRSDDAQDGLDKFVDTAKKRGRAKPTHIELAKATVGDFETWLKDADTLKGGLCVPVAKAIEKPAPKPVEKPVAKAVEKPAPPPRPRPERQYTAPRQPSYPSGGGGGGGTAPIQGIR